MPSCLLLSLQSGVVAAWFCFFACLAACLIVLAWPAACWIVLAWPAACLIVLAFVAACLFCRHAYNCLLLRYWRGRTESMIGVSVCARFASLLLVQCPDPVARFIDFLFPFWTANGARGAVSPCVFVLPRCVAMARLLLLCKLLSRSAPLTSTLDTAAVGCVSCDCDCDSYCCRAFRLSQVHWGGGAGLYSCHA